MRVNYRGNSLMLLLVLRLIRVDTCMITSRPCWMIYIGFLFLNVSLTSGAFVVYIIVFMAQRHATWRCHSAWCCKYGRAVNCYLHRHPRLWCQQHVVLHALGDPRSSIHGCFCACAWRAWNGWSQIVTDCSSLLTFKKYLKTFVIRHFCLSF